MLSHRGFEPASPQAAGLSVRHRPGTGLVLRWSPGQDLIGPTLQARPHPADAEGHTEFRGIRSALMLAISEILRAAGFTVIALGTDLIVTAGPNDSGAAQGPTADSTCPAPRRSRPARQVAAA
ncbi:hypothetical protein BX265_0451 [Streptomyces sp. TLI_235]|nr:hypothetical protein BX265_0451 [Streptomyces sp. TLI_235]